MNEPMKCDICGKLGAIGKHTTRSFGSGDHVVVIDRIPFVFCPHCGESYFTAETLHEVERLRIHHQELKARSMAPVLSFV